MIKKISFSIFDTGETILGAIVFSVFFPLYITKYISVETFTFFYGLIFLISFIISLKLGKIADERNLRKRFFTLFSISVSILTLLLAIVSDNYILSLLIFFLLAIAHQQNLVFYNSLLTDFKEKGFVSGLGVSLGYIGSAVALMFFAQYLKIPYVYIFTALVFMLLALPSILFMENPNIKPKKINLKKIFSDKEFLLIIVSILFLTEIANTLISLMGVYLKEVYKLENKEIYKVIGFSSVGGIAGGIIWGYLTKFFDIKNLFVIGFILWFSFLIILPFTPKDFLIVVGLFAGFSLSHLWTTSRVLIIEVFPENEVSTRLSFLSITERISSSLGLIIWSFFLYLTHSYKLSVLFMSGFVLIGACIFTFRDKLNLILSKGA